MWWPSSAIPDLQIVMQEDTKYEATLGYTERAWTHIICVHVCKAPYILHRDATWSKNALKETD